MPKNLTNLVIEAFDEVERIRDLQQLLQILQREFDDSDVDNWSRVNFLIDLYMRDVQQHLNDLKLTLINLNVSLEEVRRKVGERISVDATGTPE